MITLNLAKATVAAMGPPQLIAIALIGVIVLAALMISLVFLKFFKLWLQAKLSRADVTYAELVGMYLRHSDYRTIVLSRITAVQGGLNLSTRDLESHFLAGGRVANVVRALIVAGRKDVELCWKDATVIDLEGRDVLAEVQGEADSEAVSEARQQLRFGDVGQTVSALEPGGQVRFGDVIVEAVAENENVGAGEKVEILEVVVRAIEE